MQIGDEGKVLETSCYGILIEGYSTEMDITVGEGYHDRSSFIIVKKGN